MPGGSALIVAVILLAIGVPLGDATCDSSSFTPLKPVCTIASQQLCVAQASLTLS
jgi:hypothetical protein